VRLRSASLLILLTACGKAASTGPTSYDVSYRLSTTTVVTFDSVKYEDAQGVLVKVVGPPANWAVVVTVAAGGYVQASAWGLALSSGGSATLKVTWTASGISTASDSSTAAISSPGGFMLAVARRRI
jgi:hypothetical protein